MGGLCLYDVDVAGDDYATYSMTDAHFTSWVDTPAVLTNHADWERAATTANILAFQRFWCPEAAAHNFTCYKWQPAANSVDGDPRFDTDSSNVVVYFFDATDNSFQSETLSVLTGAS